MLHLHTWEEVARHYQPPPAIRKISNSTEELFREVTFGVTVVELRCKTCGDIAERRLVGDARG